MILNKVTKNGLITLLGAGGDEAVTWDLAWPVNEGKTAAAFTHRQWSELPDGPYVWDGKSQPTPAPGRPPSASPDS